jgi:hypothetical protein
MLTHLSLTCILDISWQWAVVCEVGAVGLVAVTADSAVPCCHATHTLLLTLDDRSARYDK